jgi:hypothetical protein
MKLFLAPNSSYLMYNFWYLGDKKNTVQDSGEMKEACVGG